MFFGKKTTVTIPNLISSPLLIIENTGAIHSVNAVFCEIFSIDKDEVLNKNYHEIRQLKPIEKNINTSLIQRRPENPRLSYRDKHFEVSITPLEVDRVNCVSVHFYEITPFLEIERELLKRNRELMIINTLSGAFISSENIEEVFSALLEKVLLITDFTTGWIMLRDEADFEVKSSHGISKVFLKEMNEGKIVDLCDNIAKINDPLYIFEEDEIDAIPVIKREGIVILSAIPIKVGNKLRGIMFLASRVNREFDFNLASILSLIGSQFTLIVEKIELFEETRRLSITDSLTGLFNSRHFYEALDKEVARAGRYRQIFSLAIFDIDDFKVMNDTYGHQVGDEILRKIAGVILKESRETDIVARYGGEEFVVIFPNTPKHDALAVAERILRGVESSSLVPDIDPHIRITISGGIASYPEDGSFPKDLLYRADMAMYKAKSAGKKQVVCYNVTHEKGIQKT
ncbi:MAG: diguanylate cyclase [Nitrospirota bacterium]|nr:MAG: diguanylate cyclase [Nitrospirota bacterium]